MGSASPYFVLLASATSLGLVLTPLAMMFARSFGLVDKPNVRKVHKTPIPRVGGLAMVIASMLPLIVLVALRYESLGLTNLQPGLTLIMGAISVAAIGLLDDFFEVPSKHKLLALLVASTAFCAAGGAMKTIIIGGHPFLQLGIASWPITMLWIVGVTVSINFIDGLDGLAGGIALVCCGVIVTASAVGGNVAGVLIGTSLAGALLAFLAFNRHPARVFMGDCGSMFLGFLLAGTCVMSNKALGTPRAMLLPALVLSIPLLDTFLTMVRRGVLMRSSLFAAERGHVHHRLLDTGLSHAHAVILLLGVTLAAGLVSVICIFGGSIASIAAATVFFLGLTGLFRMAGSVRARDTLAAVRRNRAIGRDAKKYQDAFHELQLRFRDVRDFEGWWKMVCQAAEAFDFAKIDLPLVRRDGTETVLRWRRGSDEIAAPDSIIAEVPIPQRRSDVSLRATIEVIVTSFLESGGHRLALFSRLMGEFGLNRVSYKQQKSKKFAEPEEDAVAFIGKEEGALPGVRVAIVHDFLYTYAGAERVLEQMLAVFPRADLFSLFDFLPSDQRDFIGNRPVTSSFLQRLPFARKKHRAYLPLMPLAIEQLDVSKYDLVLSSSYMAAKGVITRPDQLHVCYCHTPVRFAWDLQNQYLGQTGLKRGIRSLAAKMVLHYIRSWDVRSANGVDVFLTNSDFVGRRIQKVYRRSSLTLYPPVNTEFFDLCEEKEGYYLTASRMVPYKRIDLIVEAFGEMPKRRLVVVGDGPEMDRIRAKAGPNVTLLGHQSADDLKRYMQQARAFVFAAEEDFGIAPVEAQACGTPVIAFGRGGTMETVVEGKTGTFFQQQTVNAIVRAVERFEEQSWDYAAIREHALQFSACKFRESLAETVKDEWLKYSAQVALVGKRATPPASVESGADAAVPN